MLENKPIRTVTGISDRKKSVFNFKLEEENTVLLLHLLKVVEETAVFNSVTLMRCKLVVGFLQATK